MKRDMDLVRQILLKIEEHEHGRAPERLLIDGYNEEQIGYHVFIMGKAKLLDVVDATFAGSSSPAANPLRMTWEGHDFLDAARLDSVWEKAKKRLGDQLSSIPFEVLKTLLFSIVRQNIGLPDQ